MSGPGAAWYPDPHDGARLRWWDGGRWTEHTHPQPGAEPSPAAVATLAEPRPTLPAQLDPVMPSTGGQAASVGPIVTPVARPETTVGTPGDPLLPRSDVDQARRGRRRIHRAGFVLLAILVAGGGAYAAGLLNELTVSTPDREPSSALVRVVEGKGYSFEVPNFWVKESVDDTGFDYGYSVLQQSVVAIGANRVPGTVDLTDPNVRAFVFETASRAFQLELGGIPPTSTVPFNDLGAPGQQVRFSQTTPEGEPFEASQTVFVHDRRVFTVTIITQGFLADSGKTGAEFDALLASFRFDSR